jgi:methionine synthase II (cobalamin-independent)
MFATLVGPCPRPPEAGDDDAAVRLVLAGQHDAGLEPLTDGDVRGSSRAAALATSLAGIEEVDGRFRATAVPHWHRPVTVEGWRFAASLTERAVKQAIVGPYTLGRMVDATRIGDDPVERTLFREAQRRLTAAVGDVHLSLAICGGSADAAGEATIFEAPYRSYLFDLIAGPDNWRLIARAPGDRGIVCGALDPARSATGALETLVWAARYAASTGGRGMSRVGLAPAGGLERVSPERARAAMETLGRAVRLAEAPRDELAKELDPRAFDAPWNRRT